jgi:uncharacterized membrane protein required for colicin V production
VDAVDGTQASAIGMYYVDIAVAAAICFFALRGYSKGLFHEVMTLLALVVALTAAFRWTPDVVPRFADRIPGPAFVDTGISFLFLFGLTGMTLRFIVTMIERMWVTARNSPANRLGGAVFGIFKGGVVLGCAVLMLRTFTPTPMDEGVRAKVSGPVQSINVKLAQSMFAARLADLTSGLFSTVVDAAEIRLRMLAAGDNEGS